MTNQEIESWKNKIDQMTQVEMALLQRFAPSEHPIFRSDLPLFDYFDKRFQELGGMTPQISKKINIKYFGW